MDLSELPQHILHHILNFLPTKEAARTSTISKTWKSAWHSRSKVDLDLNIFKPYEENFPEFARKTMERYVEQGLGVESLMISWTALMSNDHQILDSMQQWIDFVFAAGDDKCWLQNMVSRFVSLESFRLYNLYNANKEAIKISSPSLRRLVIRNCKSFEFTTVINAPNLRSVEFLLNGYPFYSLPKSNKLSLVQFSSGLDNQPINVILFRKLKELFAETSHIEDTRMTIRCFKKASITILHEDFSNLKLWNDIIDNLKCLNRGLTFTIEKSSSSWEDLVERRTEGDAIYIASSSSHKTNFNKDEFYEKVRIGWTKRPRYCPDAEPYDLKDIEIESVNLEQDIDIREDIDAALLRAYRALSFKFTRLIYLPYYNKRRRGEFAAKEHRKILKKRHR